MPWVFPGTLLPFLPGLAGDDTTQCVPLLAAPHAVFVAMHYYHQPSRPSPASSTS